MSQLDFLNFEYNSEDEDGVELGAKRGGEEINADDKENNEEEGPTIELKKKARKKPRPFNEDVLTNRDGLVRIYEEFPTSCKFRGRGKETEDLKRLLGMYKEWSFQLYPNLALPDILARCDTLGGKGKVRNHMEQLRDRERCRYLNEVLHVPLSEIRMKVLNDLPSPPVRDMTSPEATSPSFEVLRMDGELLASPILTANGNGNRQLDLLIPQSATKGIFDEEVGADEEEMEMIRIAEESERAEAAKAAAAAVATNTAVEVGPREDELLDGLDEDELAIDSRGIEMEARRTTFEQPGQKEETEGKKEEVVEEEELLI